MNKYKNWIKENRIKTALVLFFVVFLVWFFTREVQAELPYKLSGSEVITVKEGCKVSSELIKHKLSRIYNIELVGHGYSEFGGYCYGEYLKYFDDWTSKTLYNTTQENEILSRKWPDDAGWYQRGFDWFILGKRRFYQNTF